MQSRANPEESSPKVTYLMRLAIARLAEILARPAEIDEVLWIRSKHGLDLKLDRGYYYEPAMRRVLLALLSQAYVKQRFGHVFSDVIDWRLQSSGGVTYRHVLEGEGDWKTLRRALQLLGLECTLGKDPFEVERLVLLPTTGDSNRQEALDKLRAILQARHPTALSSLQGSYEAYQRAGSDGRRQACESARNALENLVRDVTRQPLGPGLQELSNDSDSRKELLLAARDFLSGRGPHATEQPSDEDSLLALRVTEETMVWILKRVGEWS